MPSAGPRSAWWSVAAFTAKRLIGAPLASVTGTGTGTEACASGPGGGADTALTNVDPADPAELALEGPAVELRQQVSGGCQWARASSGEAERERGGVGRCHTTATSW